MERVIIYFFFVSFFVFCFCHCHFHTRPFMKYWNGSRELWDCLFFVLRGYTHLRHMSEACLLSAWFLFFVTFVLFVISIGGLWAMGGVFGCQSFGLRGGMRRIL